MREYTDTYLPCRPWTDRGRELMDCLAGDLVEVVVDGEAETVPGVVEAVRLGPDTDQSWTSIRLAAPRAGVEVRLAHSDGIGFAPDTPVLDLTVYRFGERRRATPAVAYALGWSRLWRDGAGKLQSECGFLRNREGYLVEFGSWGEANRHRDGVAHDHPAGVPEGVCWGVVEIPAEPAAGV